MGRAHNENRGFTIIELMVASAVGLLVIAGAVSLYSQALKASWVTSQKSEMQQDLRAAAILMQRDISMAGAGALGQQGLSNNGAGLPTPTTTKSVYPCSATVCNYINGTSVAFPLSPTGAPQLYSIIPGPALGITVNAATGPSDILTVVSADTSLSLNCYSATIDPTGTIVTFQLPSPVPATCIMPTNILTPQSLMDAIVGLQAGDVVLFGTAATGVVTGTVSTCSPASGYSACYTVNFAASDVGHINQPTTANGSLSQFVTSRTGQSTISVTAVRILMITYYLDISPTDGVTPRLMRIQNGKLPAPVAENVVNLQFTYDVNNNGTISANQSTLPAGTTPAMITQVNIDHLSIRSQLPGTNGYQSFDLQTAISARNLTSQQEYPITATN